MSGEATVSAVPVPRRVGELVGIQYLRGIAAMMVVVFHLQPQLARMGYQGSWLPGLSSGVDIFFVISGLIMVVTTAGKPITPVQFWWRRIVRIVPLYWLFTALMTALMLVAPKLLQTSIFELHHVIASFLFVAAPHPAKPVMEPVVMPGWTLNYEMFFYLLFGLSLLAPQRWRILATCAALLVLVVAGIAAAPEPETLAGFYTSTIMLEFAFGMILGHAALGGALFDHRRAWLGWALLVGGLVLLIAPLPWPPIPRFVGRGLPAMLVVAGAMVVEARGGFGNVRLLHGLGDSSYSLYLSHVVTMSAVSQAWRKLHLDGLPFGLLLFCVAATVASGVVGWFCYLWLERPLTRLFRHSGKSGTRLVAASGTSGAA